MEEELNSTEEQNKTSSSEVKQKVSAEKNRKLKMKRKKCTKESGNENVEEEEFCIVCPESYSELSSV